MNFVGLILIALYASLGQAQLLTPLRDKKADVRAYGVSRDSYVFEKNKIQYIDPATISVLPRTRFLFIHRLLVLKDGLGWQGFGSRFVTDVLDRDSEWNSAASFNSKDELTLAAQQVTDVIEEANRKKRWIEFHSDSDASKPSNLFWVSSIPLEIKNTERARFLTELRGDLAVRSRVVDPSGALTTKALPKWMRLESAADMDRLAQGVAKFQPLIKVLEEQYKKRKKEREEEERKKREQQELDELCDSPKPGESVDYTDKGFESMAPRYRLSRSKEDPNLYYADINFNFTFYAKGKSKDKDAVLASEEEAHKRNQVFSQDIYDCLEKVNPKLTGPNGKRLEVRLYLAEDHKGENNPPPEHHLDVFPYDFRQDSGTWSDGRMRDGSPIMDCPTMAHEILHVLGLPDEYYEDELGYYTDREGNVVEGPTSRFTYEYDCRIRGPWDSVMRDHIAAFNRKQLLYPAQFNAIVQPPVCLQRSSKYLQCTQRAYETSVINGCSDVPDYCKNGSASWLK